MTEKLIPYDLTNRTKKPFDRIVLALAFYSSLTTQGWRVARGFMFPTVLRDRPDIGHADEYLPFSSQLEPSGADLGLSIVRSRHLL